MIILEKIILFLHKNICCGYSIEAPRRGASNEYHNICFYAELGKIIPKLSSSTPPYQVFWTYIIVCNIIVVISPLLRH